jgi:hypothetical protein
MNQNFYRNGDHSTVWSIQPGNQVLEVFLTKTEKGMYTRINEYKATESDIRFIELTNDQIDRHVFFSIVDEIFGFYQSLFHQPS